MRIHKVMVMGVAGCGKSTLAARLATALDAEWIEGDDHPIEAGKATMRQGTAVQAADRGPWLTRLTTLLVAAPGNAVLACAALTRSDRAQLRAAVPQLRIVYVDIALADAIARVSARGRHRFPPSLVLSQFAILEAPAGEPGVLQIPADQPVDTQVQQVLRWITEDTLRQDDDATQSEPV
ncbi:gluconokinase [Ralstonia solanacearum]|uniref:Gluconokinase n=1 Tax=Ralstonia solanacearum TaxID=305 RepID=A0AAD0SB49_RALSL|nr:gluconokinase [Ralstonia solanacearum]AXV83745.1 gluconokinase [Ralstonia solanacearum]AXW54878.1 gluconokinase [Ralstonia solanacearum]